MQRGCEKTWRGEYLGQAFILLVLLAAVFPGTFLWGELIIPADILFESPPWNHYAPEGWEHAQNRIASDVLTAFTPWRYAMQQALEQGEWPLWNPYFLTGLPLLANCQSAVLYPPSLLFAFFELFTATTLFVLLKLWLCGMAMFWCARAAGLRVNGARFASVGWMLSTFNLLWCGWSIPNVSIWLPVLFAGTELILNGQGRRGFFAVSAGGVLMALAGHPETAVAMCLGLGFYFALRLGWRIREFAWVVRVAATWCAAWLFVAVIAAPQWVPFVEYLLHSYKSYIQSNVGPEPGYKLGMAVSLWVPRFFGSVVDLNFWGDLDSNRASMIYAGIPAWMGASLLLARKGASRRLGVQTACLVITCVFFVLLAFELPTLGFIHNLPLFSLMKRSYHIAFVMFALPLLGGMGLDHWLERDRKLWETVWCILAVAVIALFAGVTYRFYGALIRTQGFEGYALQQMGLALGSAIICLGLIVLSGFRIRKGFFYAAFIALLAADLAFASRGINTTLPRSSVYPDTALTSFLQSQPEPCRFGLCEGLVAPGLMTPYGIEDLSGYDGLYPERIMRLQYTLRSDIWNAMEPVYGIRYYLHEPALREPQFPLSEPGRFERAGQFDGIEVYENKWALPRAFLAPRTRVVPDVDDLFRIMRDPTFDPAAEVLVEAPVPGFEPLEEGGSPGSAEITHRSTTRLTVKGETRDDAILVVSDAFYPGWKARLDGHPVAVFPAYYAFRGILFPQGQHTVEFYYAPLSFYGSLFVSAAALAASLIVAAVFLMRRPRREAR